MSEAKFKTMRHIETVRNYIGLAIKELMCRAERHDQTKLESPEAEVFEVYTHKLRGCTYGSEEYKQFCREMKPAIEHHQKNNRHHPEYFENGINGMTLIDLLEMILDWKSSGMRHDDGDLSKSIEINKDRFKISGQLEQIIKNTAEWINAQTVFHKARES